MAHTEEHVTDDQDCNDGEGDESLEDEVWRGRIGEGAEGGTDVEDVRDAEDARDDSVVSPAARYATTSRLLMRSKATTAAEMRRKRPR